MTNGRNNITPEDLAKLHEPAAAGVLVYCESTGEFLLMKRNPKAKAYPATWSVPSGESHVNQLESMDECAKREFNEETSVQIPSDNNFWCIDRYPVDDRMYFVFIWKVKKKFFVKLDAEHTEAGWFMVDNLPDPISPQILDAIKRIA